mmetsp:Transcript_9004/g.12805  ORF Transcript_9004/g.12805 Transcript_9004/m.12805 type:complete len:746 (+) Transcript_9004:168-2405(+)
MYKNQYQSHADRTQERGDQSQSSMIRKVRSLDFAALKKLSQDNLVKHNKLENNVIASKFSYDAHAGRFSVRRRSRRNLPELSFPEFEDELDISRHSDCSRAASEAASELSSSSTRATITIWNMIRGPRAVGYLSVMMLLIVTLSNFALGSVHAQLHQLEAPWEYDSLSADVIRPPFSYKNSHSPLPQRNRMGLGSAAISSVTTALSPILPFTGGVDLRREEHWDVQNKGGWLPTLTSVVDQVYDAFGYDTTTKTALNIPRGGSKEAQISSSVIHQIKNKKPKVPPTPALSTAEPFLSHEDISDMTLSDVTTAFEYAIEAHREGFDETRFYSTLSPRMKKVVAAMDAAQKRSRGKDVLPAKTKQREGADDLGGGDVDTLQFCAAMRIFAEWRVLRQVPDGYKGYAVGMNLGHKDVVQNIVKIENAVHDWIEHQRQIQQMQASFEGESEDTEPLRSPTLRELLVHEKELEVHPKLPKLKEKTAAMGLLWVRRQLYYQTKVFANVLQVPDVYPDASQAVAAAYAEVYDKYHGWAVQKIFTYSFQAAPQVELIYKVMNPHYLQEVLEAAKNMPVEEEDQEEEPVESVENDDIADIPDEFSVSTEEPGVVEEAGTETTDEPVCDDTANVANGDEDSNPLERFGNHIAQEWDKLGKHIGGEWDKLVGNIVNIFDKKSNSKDNKNMNVRGGDSSGGENTISLEGEELDQYVSKEMSKDAHKHIVNYLKMAEPLLNDLADLFDELDMDDPTKV